jgi:hexosaminidase
MHQVQMSKKLLISSLLFAGAACAQSAALHLVPLPAKVEQQAGEFALNRQTVVIADLPFTNEAASITAEFHLTCVIGERQNRILLTTNGAPGLGGESYALEVDQKGATIRAQSPAGAFYGCQTLRQLAESPGRLIPFVRIEDAPRYPWRGLLLDVSRHFFDKPPLLRVLDWMADYKLNRFHLHLTDDPAWRLESQKYPALTQIGARGNHSDSNAPPRFFTRAEMLEIIAFAEKRHIVVVPEIDMPGHASAATRAFPQLDGSAHTFHPAREETYEFLQNVLLETMELFPSPWVHFGGDEVNTSGWKADSEVLKKSHAEGLKGPQQMEGYFVRRMARFIHEHGRTPMGWDEIVGAAPEAGTVVFWWRHDKPETLVQALTNCYPVVLCPRAPCYFDYPQDPSYAQIGWKLFNTLEAVYQGPAIPTNALPVRPGQILGIEACVWTERISTVSYLEFMTLPRLAALAESAWTPNDRRNFKQFTERLKPFIDRYLQFGVHCYDATDPQGSLQAARKQ